MTDIEQRLTGCFTAAFPDIESGSIPQLVASECDAWDSLATVNLAGLIEEEFDLDINPDDAKNFVSFAKIAEFLSAASD